MFYLINPIIISIYVVDVSNNNKIEVFLKINQLTVSKWWPHTLNASLFYPHDFAPKQYFEYGK